MPLPDSLATVIVTGTYLHPDGKPFVGKVTFTPEPAVLTSAAGDTIILGEVVAEPDASGHLRPVDSNGTGEPGITLLATNDPTVTPVGWTYRVVERWWDAQGRDYPLRLPLATPEVDLADIAPTAAAEGEYVVVTGPAGPTGPKGDKGDQGEPGGSGVSSVNTQIGDVVLDAADVGADLAGAATTAQAAAVSTAASDATTKVSNHTSATDPHGDRAVAASALAAHEADSTNVHGIADTAALETATGATAKVTAHTGASDPHGDRSFTTAAVSTHAGAADPHGDRADAASKYVALTGDQVVNGEKTFNTAIPVGPGFDPAFDNQLARKAYVDAAVAGAGGSSSIRTASVRITDDNLGGLPSAASWTIVQTSAATKLQCSITAAVGDRIRVVGRFMRAGSHFLDWALLDNAGAIAVYASTDTSSPLSEGDPAEYPSLSFSYDPGPPMFTVASGHISSGLVTVALVHQGTGSGTVYAHSTYPWRLRLENIGPEPA